MEDLDALIAKFSAVDPGVGEYWNRFTRHVFKEETPEDREYWAQFRAAQIDIHRTDVLCDIASLLSVDSGDAILHLAQPVAQKLEPLVGPDPSPVARFPFKECQLRTNLIHAHFTASVFANPRFAERASKLYLRNAKRVAFLNFKLEQDKIGFRMGTYRLFQGMKQLVDGQSETDALNGAWDYFKKTLRKAKEGHMGAEYTALSLFNAGRAFRAAGRTEESNLFFRDVLEHRVMRPDFLDVCVEHMAAVFDDGEEVKRRAEEGEFVLNVLEGLAEHYLLDQSRLVAEPAWIRRLVVAKLMRDLERAGMEALDKRVPLTYLLNAVSDPVMQRRAFYEEIVKDPIGKRVASYTIREVLGEGGSGVVYLADMDDSKLKRKLKLFKLENVHETIEGMRDKHTLSELVMRECDVLAQINHPHVIRYHHHGRLGDSFYVVTEHIEGATAHELLGEMTLERIEKVFRAMVSGVAHFHELGYVVRDIKLDNTIVSSDWETVKIQDLETIEQADELGAARHTHGSTRYQAPEAHRDEPASFASDVYALGASLLYMLQGEASGLENITGLPEEQYEEELTALLTQAIEKRGEKISYQLVDALGMCFGFSPEERAKNAGEILEEIDRKLELEPLVPRREGGGRYTFIPEAGLTIKDMVERQGHWFSVAPPELRIERPDRSTKIYGRRG